MATGARIASTITIPTWRATRFRAASGDVALVAERGQREPHPGAGQQLRHDRPRDRRARAGTRARPRRRRSAARRPAPSAAARRGSPRRASAASGRTVTPSAASIGDIANPATSSITSRNSTAVNAAAVNASAASQTGEAAPRGGGAATRPRQSTSGDPRGVGAGRAAHVARADGTGTRRCDHRPPLVLPSPAPAGAARRLRRRVLAATLARLAAHARERGARRASGAWTKKIARQSKSSVSAPPIAGPAAVPIRAAPSQRRRPERDSPASST